MVNSRELKRVVSNLINNSAEAIFGSGTIVVSLEKLEGCNQVQISIQDSGEGIPEEILPLLFKKGKTFGKKDGSGLGLYHAKQTVESWGGELFLDSKRNQGTIVKICLPIAASASWFVPQIVLSKQQKVVVIDDDQSIHQIWKDRIGDKIDELVHLTYPDALIEKIEEFKKSDILYLCDYEFNQSCLGIELLERLGIIEKSILVTSRFEKHILEQAEVLNLKVLPKGMAGFVPIGMK